MADAYIDLSLSGGVGAGTTGDPWDWTNFQANDFPSVDTTYHFRGDSGSVKTGAWQSGGDGVNITWQQWAGEAQAILRHDGRVWGTGSANRNHTVKGMTFIGNESNDPIMDFDIDLEQVGNKFRVENCVFVDFDKAIRLQGSGNDRDLEIDSCTFVDRTGANGFPISLEDFGDYGTGVDVTVNNCIMQGCNKPIEVLGATKTNYVDVTRCATFNCTNTISASLSTTARTLSDNVDPASSSLVTDPANENFLPIGSAVDAGATDLTADIIGTTRPFGSADDIGAYETTVVAEESTPNPQLGERGTQSTSPVLIQGIPAAVAQSRLDQAANIQRTLKKAQESPRTEPSTPRIPGRGIGRAPQE